MVDDYIPHHGGNSTDSQSSAGWGGWVFLIVMGIALLIFLRSRSSLPSQTITPTHGKVEIDTEFQMETNEAAAQALEEEIRAETDARAQQIEVEVEDRYMDFKAETYSADERKASANETYYANEQRITESETNVASLGFMCNRCIKGNVAYDSGERIYHIPGCENYDDVVVNTDYGERWFSSEAEAVDAGWRKAVNCP